MNHLNSSIDLDKVKLIVFDWDGTLANSLGSILNSFRLAALNLNLEPVQEDQIKPLIGLGLITVIKQLYPKLNSTDLNEFANQYQIAYFNQPKCVLFEGVKELLVELNNKDILMAVATGKGRQGLNQALEDTGIEDFFFETRTVHECPFKPDPTMLNEILGSAELKASEALMIGDAVCDMQMAQSISMPAIGVLSGGGTKKALLDSGANDVIESVSYLKY